jgi:hypothetical protein
MKHYHNKTELGDNDVKYLIVADGQKFKLTFLSQNSGLDVDLEIFQGVKFWQNRCRCIINGSIVSANGIIIWFTNQPRKATIKNDQFHFYTDKEVIFEITQTVGENPNLGIFNVWTTDNKRCYEFTENSLIKDKSMKTFSARHGWTKGKKPTLEFEINKL